MPSSLYIPALLVGMIITGSSNSLWGKWQDMQCVENCSDSNPAHHVLYEQPVLQTLQMFLGQMLCFLPILYAWLKFERQPVQLDDEARPLVAKDSKDSHSALEGWKVFLLWIPAACDLAGTTLMNIGLLYTPVSIFQMTRGAVVLFVGIFSALFLHRRIWAYQWISLIVVMAGVALVGYSGSLVKNVFEKSLFDVKPTYANVQEAEDAQVGTVIIGVFFVLFAQVFAAAQSVIEETILAHYSVTPLLAVGYEGLFGAITILLLCPILSIPFILTKTPFFDLARGWHQTINTPAVLWSSIAIAISISLFNFFGLSVTRHTSAMVRSLIDTCRTLAIWIVSLGLGWERFIVPISFLQVVGFSLLVYGTFLFNDLVAPPACLPKPPVYAHCDPESQGILAATFDETIALPVDLGRGEYDIVPESQYTVLRSSS